MTEAKQKDKLSAVLNAINQQLDFSKLDGIKWTVDC